MIQLSKIAQKISTNLIASECSQPFRADCDVYKVMGKIYLMSFNLDGIAVLNIKVDPIHGDMLRDSYSYIRAGYHMNKRHWISIYSDEKVDTGLIEDLILSSYDLVVSKLKKVDRLELEMLKK